MPRFMLIWAFAALLAASAIQSVNAVENASQDSWLKASLACADMGIDPGSAAFSQCVADLHHSLWAAENLYKS